MRKENLREIEREQISELGELSQRRRGRCAKGSTQQTNFLNQSASSVPLHRPQYRKYMRHSPSYLLVHLRPDDRLEAHNLLIQ
jgi:hypothetical protein